MSSAYHLVHVVTSGEYRAPLLGTQVFERAEMEATLPGPGGPAAVEVWIIVPMREALFDKSARLIVDNLRKRCPHVKITMIGSIGRLKNWPRKQTINQLRKKIKCPAVFHCRGESSLNEVVYLRQKYPEDRFILDVRGYWPMEKFVDENIYYISKMTADQKLRYDGYINILRRSIALADWVCTVSNPLRNYLVQHDKADENTVVIPCCVKETVADTHRDRIRKELNIEHKIAILYLGGTQKYQNLEDMVVPFVQSGIAQSDKVVGVFLTQNKAKMEAILKDQNVDMTRYRVLSVPQDKVAEYLTAMDLGTLFRVPSDLKDFYQPVKFGEYLSAGLPVILEEGTGEIGAILNKYKIGYIVKLSDKDPNGGFDGEVAKTLEWYRDNVNDVGKRARQFVVDNYTWAANIQNERNMYLSALQKPYKNKNSD